MINMYKYFPTIIGEVINKDHFQYENKLVNKCLHLQEKIKSGGEDWISKETYNTLGKYNLFYDNDFLEINNFINNQVTTGCSFTDYKKIIDLLIKYKPKNIFEFISRISTLVIGSALKLIKVKRKVCSHEENLTYF